jgi:hypothetical protein
MTSMRERWKRLMAGKKKQQTDPAHFSYLVHWTNEVRTWGPGRRRRVIAQVRALVNRPDFNADPYRRDYTLPDLDGASHAGASMLALLQVLEAYTQLRDPRALAPAHTAFLAGYLAHLWLDQAWIAAVFEPTFGPKVRRLDFRQRFIDHNLLRAHMDQQERTHLPPDLGATLRRASPDHWLPFAPDSDLCRWRDGLAHQLEPGGQSQTVTVFANRLGLSPEAFAARLGSQAEMERAVFRHVSPRRLRAFRRLGLARSVELVCAYLQGQIIRARTVNSPFALKARPLHNPHGVHYASHRAL